MQQPLLGQQLAKLIARATTAAKDRDDFASETVNHASDVDPPAARVASNRTAAKLVRRNEFFDMRRDVHRRIGCQRDHLRHSGRSFFATRVAQRVQRRSVLTCVNHSLLRARGT